MNERTKYQVAVTAAGTLLAEIVTEAINALAAIAVAEKMVKAERKMVDLGERKVNWSGLCFEARRI